MAAEFVVPLYPEDLEQEAKDKYYVVSVQNLDDCADIDSLLDSACMASKAARAPLHANDCEREAPPWATTADSALALHALSPHSSLQS